jgi:hypothetical protein
MSVDKPMGYKTLLLAFYLICSITLKAQIRHYDPSNPSTVPVMGLNGNLGITGVGDNYDVKYYRLEMYINPDTTKYLRGKLTTYYQTLVSGFNLLKLDFRNNMIIDSIYYRGSKLAGASYIKDADTLKITLTTRPANYLDSVSIFYQGVPDIGPSSTGFAKATHGSSPVKNYIYTLSEPYSARNWWPCKLDVRDKADSLDLIIKTPSAFKAAGNGTLVSETVTGAYRTAVWKHRYPIPAYLVATAVANYQVYESANVVIGGVSMPVYNYIFPENLTTTAKTTLDRVRPMLTAMSTAFGDYPYKLEKYGHYEFGFSGGMEHATFSGMNKSTFDGSTDWSVIAHELGHQWFGDQVTCGSWKDIWVNEGFAQFSELIAAENIPALNTYLAGHRSSIKTAAIANTTQTTYRNDTSSLGTIFSPSVYIYDRGAMILNMLRATLGDDKFFTALRNYTSDPLLSYKNAITGDVKRHMENVSGLNLTDFFNDWIYNNGHATFAISYGFSSNYVGIRAVQSKTSGSSASNFDMPLQFRVSNGTKDTMLTFFYDDGVLNLVKNGTMTNWGLNQMGVRLSFTPTSITFDPNNQILATTTSMTVNATLPIRKILLSGKSSSSKNMLSVDASFTGGIKKLILERSINGQDFDPLKSVEKPEAKESFVMNMEDANPTFSDLYYRVKVIMNDGEIGYSNIVKLSNDEVSGDIVIYPNAATDYFNVAVKSNTEKVQVKIYTQDGKLKETRQAIGKNILVKFNCVSWTKGFYLVEIHDGSTIQRRKLLIH